MLCPFNLPAIVSFPDQGHTVTLGLAATVLCAACLHTSPAMAASSWQGQIIKVSDGDTVWIQPSSGQPQRVKLRIEGIDAPERCQAWGREATQALSAKVMHQTVTVIPPAGRQHDKYGRALGRLQVHHEDVGAWMVAQGHAWSYALKHQPGPYASQQAQAARTHRGLFSQPEHIQPRMFRRTQGSC